MTHDVPTKVLVSGASGFVALHTIQQLLEIGYLVVGSVRSIERGEYARKVTHYSTKFTYEIVEEIGRMGAFDEFVKNHQDASVFIHMASPGPHPVNDIERELLMPAIHGTNNALSSIRDHGPNIKRVVITSSYAAMASEEMENEAGRTIDETSWNPTSWDNALKSPSLGYAGAKTFSEKVAWDFINFQNRSFSITTINPVCIIGPSPTDFVSELDRSGEIMRGFLTMEDTGQISAFGVDARDVAKAHIVAFEKEEAKNRRLLLAAGPISQQAIFEVIRSNPGLSASLPAGCPGIDRREQSRKAGFDNSTTRSILGFDFIPVKKSILDTARQVFTVTE
ncbi:uncharacterized protein CXQ87_004712 [Candidozyma duobushaemuli]|uniref:NAD-dependent epimerase/dehydratase domain-containing protein n=2 Tax=Candidozyma TaxID=3303203 RepID=A0ABX8IBT4_9ASCO|nr:uncharacterized protein CXQ87_004712 [[Candida] duobushaemulonis]PVH16421.1 hypothetical protein CXQ87_004712 [[Candida] duobushaemulonis]QWU90190.1 hypothetical protein CA3LBN_004551 [[Candida] haemuloni]